jgi:hypothetical protein
MAFTPGCKYDVFISYAHFDNEPDTQDVRWVSRFQTDLKKALRQWLGVEPEVFFDSRDLHAHHEIDGLMAEVSASAVFVPILSPSYVKREWTIRELEAFEATQSNRNRIVTVELLPVKEYEIPSRFLRLKRTQFWWSDENEEDVPLKLTPKSNSDKYDRRLQTLAHQMEELLRAIQAERTGGARAAPPPAAAPRPSSPAPDPAQHSAQHQAPAALTNFDASPYAGKTVLLAQVTNDLYDEREQVFAYLRQYGVEVLPEGDYLQGGAEFANAVKADLERAELFVQLLGPYRSNRPPDLKDDSGEPTSYAQFQYSAAKRRGTPVLQWRRPDLDVSAISHGDKPLLEGPDVLAMGLQEFNKEILKTFERAAAAAVAAAAAAARKDAPASEFLFINADSSDKGLTEQLLKAFDQNPNLMAAGPLYEGSADDITKDLDANLVDCETLLLVYGNAAAPWVRAQLRRLSKLERSRQEPLRRKAVLIAPPASKPDLGVVGGFTRIDRQQSLTSDDLRQIVAEMSR